MEMHCSGSVCRERRITVGVRFEQGVEAALAEDFGDLWLKPGQA